MKECSVVGKRLPRLDAALKATGKSELAGDIILSRTLWGKILRSFYARARILNIYTRKAERLPEVKAVRTGEDTEGTRLGNIFSDPPYADQNPLALDKVRPFRKPLSTITDVALMDESGAPYTYKTESTLKDLTIGVVNGIELAASL